MLSKLESLNLTFVIFIVTRLQRADMEDIIIIVEQGVPTIFPPGGPKYKGKIKNNFFLKRANIENGGKFRKFACLAHPRLRVWLRPCCGTMVRRLKVDIFHTSSLTNKISINSVEQLATELITTILEKGNRCCRNVYNTSMYTLR